MVTIKNYEEKYRDDVRMVCLKTGPGSALTDKKMHDYILGTYCDYYIEREPQNVLVLVDENDKAQGYCFGATNFGRYIKAFKPYLKKVRKTGAMNYISALAEIFGHRIFAKKYPAHIHIDLNEGFRGNGNGSEMVKRQLENLKKQEAKGVMLITGAGNTGAIKFYSRLGFRTILHLKKADAEIMAKEL